MKKFAKFLSMSLVMLLLSFSFGGCAKTSSQPSAGTTGKKTIKIGFAAMNFSMTWMQYALAGAKKAALEQGVTLIVTDAQNQVDTQSSQIENLIAQKVDGIITDPINVQSLGPALEEAKQAGIPVVTFDRKAEGSPYLNFVGSNDVKAGQLAAEYIAKKLNGKGLVVELSGANGSSVAMDRHKGFTEELKKFPNIKITFSQSGQFVRETGMSVMEDAITATHKKFDAVYAANDDMMMGAIQAIKSSGIDIKKIVTISNDGIPDALNSINNNELQATIQYPVALAPTALKNLINYLKTKKEPNPKDQIIDPWVIEKSNIKTGDFYSAIKK